MAQQDIRYYLNGMLLVIEKGTLQAVATDGHRLVVGEHRASPAITQRQEVILPRKTVLELGKLLADSRRAGDDRHPRQPGALPLRQRRAREQGRRRQVSRLQPRDPGRARQADRARRAPSSALRCSAPRSCRTRSSAACASCSRPDQLKIICTNSEQEEAEEELEIDYKRRAARHRLQHHLSARRAAEPRRSSSVKLAFGDANSSALVTMPERDDYKYVVMPMRI